MNYHVYNAWAVLHGRGPVDLFAAGLQSYFNPAIDLPYYLVAFEWLNSAPRAVAFLAGLPYGALVFFTILCACVVLADLGLFGPRLIASTAVLVAFGVTGSATLPQIGTTFNEIQVAALVLAGVAVMLSALTNSSAPSNPGATAFIWGGLLFGLAAGLKLTAGTYAPAAAIALLAVADRNKSAVRTVAWFSVAWALGFCVTFGWWALRLYQATGNPLFPMLENVFHTHWLSGGTWIDSQFKPQSVLQAVFYPFFWVHADRPVVAEPVFSDPRFALAMIAFAFLAVAAALVRTGLIVPLDRQQKDLHLPKTSLFVLVFIGVSYVVWLKFFSVLRYTVPIEVLLGLAIGIIALTCARLLRFRLSPSTSAVCALVFLAAVAAVTRYPMWGRAAYSDAVLKVDRVSLDPGSLVIVLGSPQAYVLPGIAQQNPSVQFVGIPDELLNAREFDLWKKVRGKILNFSGRRYAMVRNDETRPRFAELGGLLQLRADEPTCRTFDSSIDRLGFKLCALQAFVESRPSSN
jgi:hypothetical protein